MSNHHRVQNRQTLAKGTVLNQADAPVAIVQYDELPEPTWEDWANLA